MWEGEEGIENWKLRIENESRRTSFIELYIDYWYVDFIIEINGE